MQTSFLYDENEFMFELNKMLKKKKKTKSYHYQLIHLG